MIRRYRATAVALLALACLPSNARAHYIWATVDKNQARFALLENLTDAPTPQFEKYVTGLTARSGGKDLTLNRPHDGASYAPLTADQTVVVADSEGGVPERGNATYLLIYHAKGAASLEAAATATEAPAELLARREGGDLVVTLRQDGWPVPNNEVWVQWPGSEQPQSSTTDLRGDIHFPWPAAPRAGFVGIRAMVTETGSGESHGKKYDSIHHWATLTFPVAAGEKPLSKALRDAFGKNHEIVGDALFNKTLFEGKLTKAQLEVHLQQRALIHSEYDRILRAADPSLSVPYGAEQRNVLVLLRADLTALGARWPTEADAQPLTRAFRQEIRDSEKQGPYFALGVQHVYYGGITNGGRVIGQKIQETLGITLTYYEKSDGYLPYLAEVDKITDPAARAEMIRGGQEAYKYIIAVSNEDIFKAPDTKTATK